jgi:hypothetical protein
MKTKVLILMALVVCIIASQSQAIDTIQSDVPAILNGIETSTLSESTMDSVRGEALYNFTFKVTATNPTVDSSQWWSPFTWAALLKGTITLSAPGKASVSKDLSKVTPIKTSYGRYWKGFTAEQSIQYDVPKDTNVSVKVSAKASYCNGLLGSFSGVTYTSVKATGPWYWPWSLNVPTKSISVTMR